MVLPVTILPRIIRTNPMNVALCVNGFQTSSTNFYERRWRQRNGMPINPNVFGPLTNLPDYSFKDKRPTPLGTRHRARLETQRGYAERIVKLTGEVDFAVERHKKLLQQEEERRKAILDSKLKPKGALLLQK